MTLRIVRPALLLLAAASALGGCGDRTDQEPPPMDRVFFPTGLTVAPRPGGGDTLYVVSSNMDLAYDAQHGGTLLAIDPESPEPSAGALAPPVVLGAMRIPSYGGEVAVAHPALSGCEGLSGTTAIVPVRYTNQIYAIDVGTNGTLSCGGNCVIPTADGTHDPYGVTVACRATATGTTRSAYVTHLRATPTTSGEAGDGYVTEIDLDTKAAATPVNIGTGPTGQVTFDATRGLLFTSPAEGVVGYAPIRWYHPGTESSDGVLEYRTTDVVSVVSGAIVRGIALSSDRSRMYVTADVYDTSYAASYGTVRITSADLIVLDIATASSGFVMLRTARVVPMGTGLGAPAIVPRTGMRDLVVVPDTSGSTVYLYDDQVGAIAKTFGRGANGAPLLGEQPFGLAPQALSDGSWRVWVASFIDGTLSAIDIDDPTAPGTARIGKRIGIEE